MRGLNSSGSAPELLQAKLKEKLQVIAPIVEEKKKIKIEETLANQSWWFQEGKEIVPKSGKEIQELISAFGDILICARREGAQWKRASEYGFQTHEVNFEDTKKQEAVPLGTPTTKEEELLEQLPDSELEALLVKSRLTTLDYRTNGEFDRAKTVKILLEHRVFPTG